MIPVFPSWVLRVFRLMEDWPKITSKYSPRSCHMLPDRTAHYILNCLYSKTKLPVEMTNLLASLFLVAFCGKAENCSRYKTHSVLFLIAKQSEFSSQRKGIIKNYNHLYHLREAVAITPRTDVTWNSCGKNPWLNCSLTNTQPCPTPPLITSWDCLKIQIYNSIFSPSGFILATFMWLFGTETHRNLWPLC